MSFNWPDIPFTGAEVEAFVDAYKGLAESIYENWDNEALSNGYGISYLENPFTNKNVVKELLINGLLYSSFIIKQRSGGGGPGTNFDLSSSPHRPPLSTEEKEFIIKKLGCVFDPEEMRDAWNENTGGNPPPRLDDAVEDLLDELFENGPTNPENQDNEGCDLTAKEQGSYNLTQQTIPVSLSGDPLIRTKGEVLRAYLSCDNDVFTENDLPPFQCGAIKGALQAFYNETSNEQVSEQGNVLRRDLNLNDEQKAQYGASPTDTVHSFNFYNTWGENRDLRTLFGTAIVVVNSSGQVVRIVDDFDFVYGREIDRSDGSVAGSAYNNNQIIDGLCYREHWVDSDGNCVPVGTPGAVPEPPRTPQNIRDENSNAFAAGQVGRWIVATAKENNRGKPVPINLNLSNC